MRIKRKRAIIYSTVLPAVLDLNLIAEDCGMDSVALIVPRSRSNALLGQIPPNLDLRVIDKISDLGAAIQAYHPDVGLCIGYPWKFPQEILDMHPMGILNGHPSLLPRHRGRFPVAWTIREGDPVLGMAFHRMNAELDTGPILAQGSRPLPADTSPANLRPLFHALNQELLPVALSRLLKGDVGDPQEDEGATLADLFEDGYREIDWSRSAAEIDRQIRAWQWISGKEGLRGPLTTIDDRKVRVIRACLKEPEDGLGRRFETGDGLLWVLSTEPA